MNGTEIDPYQETTASGGSPGGLDHSPTPSPTPELGQALMIANLRARLFGVAPEIRVGRYRIERRLGGGGMGDVFLGVDDQLGRKLAIKLVRSDRVRDRGGEVWRERLKREARAMAKLSHPNVVQVYEVGEHEGETYLTMEYVEGQTLSQWLERAHGWREVLDVYLAAGRGLAAAHAAGVVHRDFKPDNVLIDGEGRVRVVDFGLALAGIEAAPTDADGGAAPSSVESRLTHVGGMVGTLRYMPLEQLEGRDVDARSDQFALCLSLYEALYRAQPFASDVANTSPIAARAEALRRDAPEVPRSTLPRGIWTVLRRGLRCDPDARWPDVESLLRELERAAGRRRRWALGVAAIVVSAGAWWVARPTPDPCAAIEGELVGTWDAQRRDELRDTFERSEVAEAGRDLPRFEQALDRWAAGWIEQRRDVCRAQTSSPRGRAASEASEVSEVSELGDARASCLAQQRATVSQLIEQLERGETPALERVLDVLVEVPEPRLCSAAEVVDAPRIDADAREAVAALRLEIADVAQRRRLGAPNLERAELLLDRARQLGQAPVVAEATAELGKAELLLGSRARAIELLEHAATEAITVDHRRLLAQVWLDLGIELSGPTEVELGRRYCGQARALWERLGGDADISTRVVMCEASGQASAGDVEGARARLEAALPDAPAILQPDLLAMLAALVEGEPALAWRRQALEIAEREFGPKHRRTAGHAYALGVALLDRGDAEARPLLERAAAIWMREHGEAHPDLCWAHLALAEFELAGLVLDDPQARADGLASIEAHAQACVAIHERARGPDDGSLANALMLRSRVAELRGDPRAATELLEQVLAAFESDGDAPHVLELRHHLVANWLSLGETGRARVQIDRLLAGDPGSAAPDLGRFGLAELALREGQIEQALAEFAQLDARAPEFEALGLEHRKLLPQVLVRALRILAELRSPEPGSRARALALLEQQRRDPALATYDLALWLPEFDLDADERELLLGAHE